MTTGINAFDRWVINQRERPLSTDINLLQARAEQSLKAFIRSLFIPHSGAAGEAGSSDFYPLSGFLGDAFFPTATGTSRIVTLTPGLGMILGNSPVSNFGSVGGLDDLDPYYPVYAPRGIDVTIDAAPSVGQERYDIIEVTQDRRLENPLSRDIFDNLLGVFVAGTPNKTFAQVLDSTRLGRVVSPANSTTGIGYKVGTPAAVGGASIPATSPGYTQIAVVYSLGTIANVRQRDLRDDRKVLLPGGHGRFGLTIVQSNGTPDTISIEDVSASAGLRFAARSGSSPGGVLRVYVLNSGIASVIPHAQIGVGLGNLLTTNIYDLDYAVLTDTEYAALVAAYPDCQPFGIAGGNGQPYAYFDIARHLEVGADPASRTYYISGEIVIQ